MARCIHGNCRSYHCELLVVCLEVVREFLENCCGVRMSARQRSSGVLRSGWIFDEQRQTHCSHLVMCSVGGPLSAWRGSGDLFAYFDTLVMAVSGVSSCIGNVGSILMTCVPSDLFHTAADRTNTCEKRPLL